MRYELADFEWLAIKPMLPNKPRGVPRMNDRRVLNGIFWVLRSGAPWRDLPSNFGPYTTCYNRFVRWRCAGVWAKIMNALADPHDVVDTNGLPVRIALTAGEAHDNRLAKSLLSRLKSGTMLLADRGYDADWIRPLQLRRAHGPTSRHAAIATIRSASAGISIEPGIWSSGSSTGSSTAGAWRRATTN
jgi:transposase